MSPTCPIKYTCHRPALYSIHSIHFTDLPYIVYIVYNIHVTDLPAVNYQSSPNPSLLSSSLTEEQAAPGVLIHSTFIKDKLLISQGT